MSLANLHMNWFDALVVLILLVGMKMGRKTGMTEELFLTSQWLAIVFAGAYLYRPLGDFLVKTDPSEKVFCYVAVYAVMAVIIKLIVSGLRTKLLEKLQHLNLFGNGEYYFGMLAGVLRFGCILVVCMAILNAPVYTYQERVKMKAAMYESYGSDSGDFLPKVYSLQDAVFKDSALGSAFKSKASVLLIAQNVEAPSKKTRK